jgi:regulator of cell morphogenesis and NO signaling
MTQSTPSAALPAIAADTTLASLATTYAGASRVFLRHGLDFCCNGHISVGEACLRKKLDREQILGELRAELSPVAPADRWDDKPTDELVQHVLTRYHAGHRAELPRLLHMAEKVERVHAGKPDCPRGLAAHLHHVAHDLELHMQKEEMILFPMLRSGQGMFAGGPIQVMEEEHQEHGRNLAKIRALAHDLVPPPAACGTWRALYLGLAELEREVMQHIHLENHVLFPRAAAQ